MCLLSKDCNCNVGLFSCWCNRLQCNAIAVNKYNLIQRTYLHKFELYKWNGLIDGILLTFDVRGKSYLFNNKWKAFAKTKHQLNTTKPSQSFNTWKLKLKTGAAPNRTKQNRTIILLFTQPIYNSTILLPYLISSFPGRGRVIQM